MGLDMYLHKRVTMYRLPNGELTTGKDMEFSDYYHSDEFGVSNSVEISSNIGYWCKANAIHKWFVDNVQDGTDDCKEYYVTEEKLKELYKTCKDVLKLLKGKEFFEVKDGERDKNGKSFVFNIKNIKKYFKNPNIWYMDFEDNAIKEKISEILPSQSGFFFGSTEYDGCYVYDVIKTIIMLDNIFADIKNYKKTESKYGYDIYYSASW